MTLPFLQLLQLYQVPAPLAEHRFHETRRWRFDYAWVEQRLALEVEGGAFSAGRHIRPEGFLADCEKYSEAAALGWRILRVPPSALATLPTIRLIQRALGLEVAA